MLQVAVLKEEKAEREKLRLDKAATRRRKAKSNRK
jgi:hypothetical protein